MKSSRFSIAIALLVCVAMIATIVPTGATAALPSERTFISEGAEEPTFALWDAEWKRYDANGADLNYDTWCRTMHEVHGGTHAVYCAKNGDNSHYYNTTTNVQALNVNLTASSDPTQQDHILRYDTGMDTIMRKQLDSSARYYGTVTITFWFYSDTGASDAKQTDGTPVGYDFLNVVYFTGAEPNLVKTVAWTISEEEAGSKTWTQKSVEVPNTATWVGFEFVSGTVAPAGGDPVSPSPLVRMVNGGMREGVFLDDITVIGSDKLPAQELATAVEPLPETQNSLTFNVSWTNNDPEVGMKWIDLYYRVDGTGNWIRYETDLRPDGKFPNNTRTIEFTAPREGTYEFFTRGTDNLNVVEPARNAADASTKVVLGGPVPGAPSIAIDPAVVASNGDVKVNFEIANATTLASLQYSLDDEKYVSMNVTDRSVELTGLSAGDHVLTIKAIDSSGNVVVETTSFSIKSGSLLGSTPIDPLVLVGIVAVVIAAIAGAFYFLRRKK